MDDGFAALLQRAAEGDPVARRQLWHDHYDMLKRCASQWFEKHWGARGNVRPISLAGTELLHAAFERLHDRTAAMVNGRAYFFRAFYSECMRICVDRWRSDRGKGKGQRVEFHSQLLAGDQAVNFDRVYDILDELERRDARMGQIAMLKVLESCPDESKPGARRALTNSEVAELMGISLRLVEQEWRFAKAYLMTQLGVEPGREGEA